MFVWLSGVGTEAVSTEGDGLVGGAEAGLGEGRAHGPPAHRGVEDPHRRARQLVEGLQLAVILYGVAAWVVEGRMVV